MDNSPFILIIYKSGSVFYVGDKNMEPLTYITEILCLM